MGKRRGKGRAKGRPAAKTGSGSRRSRRWRHYIERDERLADAQKWLVSARRGRRPKRGLVEDYVARYRVSAADAHTELVILGFRDELAIEFYEAEGTAWEYRVEARSGELIVVPVGTPEHELIQYALETLHW